MDAKYNHLTIEKDKNDKWIKNESFFSKNNGNETFTIILPPPNVTGKLHLGHAWDGYLQDLLIRFNKLKGKDVMWIPSMDHAGIATQAKVESKLNEEGISRYDLGRKKFINKVWEWKEEYASIIKKQWGVLGLALDFSQERFTLDKNANEAVNKVFIEMYNKGLIYKGKKAINWDPKMQTALSNIEVISKQTDSTMYYFKYKIEGEEEFLSIATTRPETMFSDVAVVLNPKDPRAKKFKNNKLISPLTGQVLPIIFDSYVELDFGTGAMKLSAHAAIDIEIIKNNNLEIKESIDKHGKMNNLAIGFEGQDRFVARKNIVSFIENKSLLIKKENIKNNVGYSERSGEVVETIVSDQWFVKMDGLSKKVLEHLDSKDKVNFVPERFQNTLKQWMENVFDWTISRQLWWGHRIPAWYKEGETKVQVESPGDGWKQDEDVLDTWFSSALSPFVFLGWPQSNEMVEQRYPTSVLVTGYDIIFFWVARMYFQGMFFMKDIPFKNVLIHGLVRDADGNKMSKSLGNGIDPMDVIKKYGSDSLRWFLLTNSSPGQDIRYSIEKIESAWNLNNKIWNISRFILDVMEDTSKEVTECDKWILNKLSNLEKIIDAKMESYDFSIIGKELYVFIQEDFSSWYIEFSKTNPNKKIAIEVLKKLMIILHPFMPFISDHIYHLIDKKEVADETWPSTKSYDNTEYIDRVIKITKIIRSFRAEKQISNSEEILYFPNIELSKIEIEMINKLSNSSIHKNNDAKIPLDDFLIYIKLSDEMKKNESERIEKEKKYLESEIKRAENILLNKNFIEKAPESKINIEKDKLKKYKEQLKVLGKDK